MTPTIALISLWSTGAPSLGAAFYLFPSPFLIHLHCRSSLVTARCKAPDDCMLPFLLRFPFLIYIRLLLRLFRSPSLLQVQSPFKFSILFTYSFRPQQPLPPPMPLRHLFLPSVYPSPSASHEPKLPTPPTSSPSCKSTGTSTLVPSSHAEPKVNGKPMQTPSLLMRSSFSGTPAPASVVSSPGKPPAAPVPSRVHDRFFRPESLPFKDLPRNPFERLYHQVPEPQPSSRPVFRKRPGKYGTRVLEQEDAQREWNEWENIRKEEKQREKEERRREKRKEDARGRKSSARWRGKSGGSRSGIGMCHGGSRRKRG